MPDDALIAETNRLLRTILEKDAEQRVRSKESIANLETKSKEREAKRQEERKAKLREQGLPDEAIEGSEEEWEARHKAAQKASQERIEIARQKSEEYQQALLSELRIQSDLLRQIAERLER